ncbi:MAG: EpsD family peptidyl-prolyl cis-trans isomerase [Rhodoferax sp.]|nr:EpsD family peptidyl-prolyl cis-trans isomerase [Rhodoferax sp.]
MKHSFFYSVAWVSLALGSLALSACGEHAARPLPATQVAARVGNEEISIHQINSVLAQENANHPQPQPTPVKSRAILENLIDQQLAIDQALANQLHRTPEVMAQLDAARREVLAAAYIRQFAASLPPPELQEAKRYYTEHPELFAQRRIFNIQEIVTPNTPDVLARLQAMAAANSALEDAMHWLNSHKIAFQPGAATRAAEQIPLALLPRMHALKDGQNAVFATPTTITLLRLVGSRTVPIAEADALPRITRFLGNQRMADAITAQMKTLRSKTQVEYLGEFQNPAQPHGTAPAPTRTSATSTPEAKAPALPNNKGIEKGLAGLNLETVSRLNQRLQ